MSKPLIQLKTKTRKNATDESIDREEKRKDDAEHIFDSLSKLNDYIKEVIENNVFFIFIELLQKISQDYQSHGITFNELKERYLGYFRQDLKNSNLYCQILALDLDHINLNDIIGAGKQNMENSIVPHDSQSSQIPLSSSSSSSSPSPPSPSSSAPDEHPLSVSPSLETIAVDISKCQARIANGRQCSRKKQKDSDFCGSHLHNQPFGRIDQVNQQIPTNKKSDHLSATIDPSTTSSGLHHRLKRKKKEPQTETIPDPIRMEVTIENIDGIDYVIDNKTQKIYQIVGHGYNLNPESKMLELSPENLKLVGKKLPDGQYTWFSESDLVFIDQ